MDGCLSLMFYVISVFLCTLQRSLCESTGFMRNVTTVVCQPEANVTVPNLFHTKAVGPNDTLHYLTSSYGFPTVFVAKTSIESKLEIDWKSLLSNDSIAKSIKFTLEPDYVFGLMFTQLLEYDDVNDTVDLQQAGSVIHYSLAENITWSNSSLISHLDKNMIELRVENTSDTGINVNPGGSFSIKVWINNQTTRTADLPHLQESGNTSHIDIIIDNLIPSFARSRYALELVYLTQTEKAIHLTTSTSIDDEHTPGTFQVVDLSPGSSPCSYVQYKPVSYKSASRAMKVATKVRNYTPLNSSEIRDHIEGRTSILYAYLGDEIFTSTAYEMVGVNVTFGLSLDKFYTHYKYYSWSLIFGYGEAPPEEISSLIIIIISVVLGVPVLIIVFGSIGVCVYKKKHENKANSDSYETIN